MIALLALAQRAGDAIVARVAAHATGLTVMTLLFVQSNESVMRDTRFPAKAMNRRS